MGKDNAAGTAGGGILREEFPVLLELCDPGGGGGANELDPPGNDKVTVAGGVGGSKLRCGVDGRGRFAGLPNSITSSSAYEADFEAAAGIRLAFFSFF